MFHHFTTERKFLRSKKSPIEYIKKGLSVGIFETKVEVSKIVEIGFYIVNYIFG
jgi:hypothetical protein